MKLLALDTATEACSVAVEIDGRRLQRFERSGREHSRHLPRMANELMAEAGLAFSDLDGLVCGIGPGSFSGVRIGVAYAKGLALALDVPVAGISSLAMLAQGAVRGHHAQRVLAAIDARMGEVYFGVYEADAGRLRCRSEDCVCAPEAVGCPVVGSCVAVGSGWGVYGNTMTQTLKQVAPDTVIDLLCPQALPEAVDALTLMPTELGAFASAMELLPAYLRNRVALTRVEQEAARRVRVKP